MSCCVSVTVCSLLLCPVVCQWQFAACCYVLLCVSDCLQLVVKSCFVSVTVCSLLLRPVLSVTVCILLLCHVLCQWEFTACCYFLFFQWQFAYCCYVLILLIVFVIFTFCFFPNSKASISPLALPPVLTVSLHWIPSHIYDIVLCTAALWWWVFVGREIVCMCLWFCVCVYVCVCVLCECV